MAYSLERVFMVKTFLQGVGVHFEETFFQQDEARLHAKNEILYRLHEHFGDLVI
jgi:hypothetical protein